MSDSFKIGICGLGTVGASLIKILQKDQESINQIARCNIELVAVNARDKDKDRGVDLSSYRWVDDPLELAQDPEIDAVIELIGGTGLAYEIIQTGLKAGKKVITANKAVMATYPRELHDLSMRQQVNLLYDASVGGSIPVIKVLRNGVQLHKVTKIEAVLNGTCNFILDQMATKGQSFDDALKEAQEAGYAEADPSMDIDGVDTAQKLSILYMLCFGKTLGDFPVEGITGVSKETIETAHKKGEEITLMGSATENDVWVKPQSIPKDHLLANLQGAMNAVVLETDNAGPLLLQRLGAGGKATASAVLSDIILAVRSSYVPVFGWPELR